MSKQDITEKINRLEKQHCECCITRKRVAKRYGRDEASRHCRNVCKTGLRIAKLGLARSYIFESEKRWSKDEVKYLVNHLQYFKVDHIAKKLNRNVDDVKKKIWCLQNSGVKI